MGQVLRKRGHRPDARCLVGQQQVRRVFLQAVSHVVDGPEPKKKSGHARFRPTEQFPRLVRTGVAERSLEAAPVLLDS